MNPVQNNDATHTQRQACICSKRHLAVTWCIALLLAVFDYRFAQFSAYFSINLDWHVLSSIFAGIWCCGCVLQLFVSVMALLKKRGWDYIGIFMLYGFWLCAFLVQMIGFVCKTGTMSSLR
jgi:hypothetical protein